MSGKELMLEEVEASLTLDGTGKSDVEGEGAHFTISAITLGHAALCAPHRTDPCSSRKTQTPPVRRAAEMTDSFFLWSSREMCLEKSVKSVVVVLVVVVEIVVVVVLEVVEVLVSSRSRLVEVQVVVVVVLVVAVVNRESRRSLQ